MQKTLCVSYDLSKPSRNYEGLIEAIKSYGTWWHHLESTWLIVTSQSPTEVRDELSQFLDSDDKLIVFSPSKPWAGIGFSNEAYEWIKNNL